MSLNRFGRSPLGAFYRSPLGARMLPPTASGLVVLMKINGNIYAYNQSDGSAAWNKGSLTGTSDNRAALHVCSATHTYYAYWTSYGVTIKKYAIDGSETASLALPSTAWSDFGSPYVTPALPRTTGLCLAQDGHVYLGTDIGDGSGGFRYFFLKITGDLASIVWKSGLTVYQPYSDSNRGAKLFEYNGSIVYLAPGGFGFGNHITIDQSSAAITNTGERYPYAGLNIAGISNEQEVATNGGHVYSTFSHISPTLFTTTLTPVFDMAIRGTATNAHFYYARASNGLYEKNFSGTLLYGPIIPTVGGHSFSASSVAVAQSNGDIFSLGTSAGTPYLVRFNSSWSVVWSVNVSGDLGFSLGQCATQLTQNGGGHSTFD